MGILNYLSSVHSQWNQDLVTRVVCLHTNQAPNLLYTTPGTSSTGITYIPPAIGINTVTHFTNLHCEANRETYIPPSTGSTGVINISLLLSDYSSSYNFFLYYQRISWYIAYFHV